MSDADDMAARSKKLAKQLLDGLDAPDDPERIAYDDQKAITDREALEEFYIRTGQKKASPARAAARRLADRIAGVADGPFEPIDEKVSEHVVLQFAPLPSDPNGKRFVQVSVSTPTNGTVTSQWLGRGTTAELVAKLRASAVDTEIEETAEKLVKQQRMQGL